MDPKSPQHPAFKRLLLPSGKSIEVVVVSELEAPEAPRPPAVDEAPLQLCPHCGSELVQPVAWEQLADDRWRLELRCPECEASVEGKFSTAAVEAFDERLEQDTQSVLKDLKQLSAANLHEEIERFIAALKADLILPCDF